MNNIESKCNIIKDYTEQSTNLLGQNQIQQDYDYFMAQKTANMMLSAGLISLVEFNKLTQINRDTFSPQLVEIMPKIT